MDKYAILSFIFPRHTVERWKWSKGDATQSASVGLAGATNTVDSVSSPVASPPIASAAPVRVASAYGVERELPDWIRPLIPSKPVPVEKRVNLSDEDIAVLDTWLRNTRTYPRADTYRAQEEALRTA